MGRILFSLLLLAGFAGCAQLPPTPQDIQAKKFESIPDSSVIYVARRGMDSYQGHTLTLDERSMVTTYPKSYYRWEVAPGTHRIASLGAGTEQVTLTTAPGGVYYVQHTVLEDKTSGSVILSALQLVDEQTGRALVMRGSLLQ